MNYQKNIIKKIFTALFITGMVLFAYISFLPIVSAAGTAVDNYLWVTHTGGSSVLKIDKTTNAVIATIGVGSGPWGVAVDQDSVWVTSGGSGTVSRIDKTTNAVIATIGVGSDLWAATTIAVDQDSVWVTNAYNGTVSRIDKTTNAVIVTIKVGSNPHAIAVDQDSVWVTNTNSNTVSRINKANDAVVATIPVGSYAIGVAVDSDSVWVANAGQGTVTRINKTTNTVIATITGFSMPIGITVDQDSVWVTDYEDWQINYGDGTVSRIDKTTNAVIATIGVGSVPAGIAVDQDSVWVVNTYNGAVSRIDKTANAVIATIGLVGADPFYSLGDATGYSYDYFFGGPAVCGNGFKETGEQCDDGNLINGDGCSSTCTVEAVTCPSGMVSYWKFNEGSGTTAYDSVGGNDGQLIGGPTWTPGKVGGALSFDGVDDYVDVGIGTNLDIAEAITIEAWAKRSSFGGFLTEILGKYNYDNDKGYNLYFDGYYVGHPNALMFTNQGVADYPGNIAITDSAWHHIVATYDRTNVKLYVDGVLDKTYPATSAITSAAGYPFLIGARHSTPYNAPYNGWFFFNGALDELAIYNRALSAGEIQQQYQNGLNRKGYCEVVDTTAPVAPDAPDLQAASDTGSFSTDNITNDNTPSFDISGLEPNSTVTVYDGSNILGTMVIPGGHTSGTFTPASPMNEGIYVITATQTDTAGNVGPISPAMVPNLLIDTTPPVIAAHADVIVEATSPAGAIVTYASPTATDNYDTSVAVTCIPVSGSIFSLGDTTVTCNATDLAGNGATPTMFIVHVIDTTKPTITIITPVPYGLYTVGTALNFSATDDQSGIASVVGDLVNTLGVSITVQSGFKPEPGVYTLVVTATDKAGNIKVSDTVNFVVYDPSGGFATGGGWFYSDSESNLSSAGKANFGFNAKYKESGFTGNLEFQSKSGPDINLKSATIDWLVISGTSTQFQGTGTINGTGLYTFRVMVTDNAEPGIGADHFDIRIWGGTDTSAGIVYKAKNTLSGGNIVVHKK